MADNPRASLRWRLLCVALGAAVALQGFVGLPGSGAGQAQAQQTKKVRVAPFSKTITVPVTRISQ